MTMLVPIVTTDNAAHFCVGVLGAPFTFEAKVGDTTVTTGILRMGQQVSLLGLAYSKDLLDTGEIDHTDSLSADVRLSSLAIGTPDGTVHEIIEIPNLQYPQPYFTATTERQQWKLKIDFKSDELRWHGKILPVNLVGAIDLQTSVCELHAVNPKIHNSELSIIGYTLWAERINHNRRPRHVQV